MILQDFIKSAQVGSTIVIKDLNTKKTYCIVTGSKIAPTNPISTLLNREIMRHSATSSYHYQLVVAV